MSNNLLRNQWNRREGYGGPESFPESGLAEFAIGHTDALAGQECSLFLTDGRVIQYSFQAETLTIKEMQGGHGHVAQDVDYKATEAAPGIFFLNHAYNSTEHFQTCVVLDMNRNLTTVIDGEVPAEGEDYFRMQKSHVGGGIGEPSDPEHIVGPAFPSEIVGKRFVAKYSERYAWELIYMNKSLIAWQGLKGNPGIGDTEEYAASAFEPGVYVVSWSEQLETLSAVFLYNFNEKTITGFMWGYAPEFRKFLNAPLGGKIVDPSEYGLQHTLPDGIDAAKKVKQKNIDVVLRAHHEVWNQGNYDAIPEIYAEDYQAHFICEMEFSGHEGVRETIVNHRIAFPDWTEEVVDIIADGDRVVTRYISTATHEGEFQGVPASGKKIIINEVSIHRVLDGKIVEQWGFPDGLSHIQQMTEG
ncbi:ester cyclase [Gammaproteobacteria bacterium]|nr:ester cyclase [Gammaproteobacteria bacterium]